MRAVQHRTLRPLLLWSVRSFAAVEVPSFPVDPKRGVEATWLQAYTREYRGVREANAFCACAAAITPGQ